MALLHISEFAQIQKSHSRVSQAVEAPGLDDQQITYTTSTQSAAFNADTNIIRVFAAVACFLEFGVNPTATAGSLFLPPGTVEYFGVKPGSKVAVHDGSS